MTQGARTPSLKPPSLIETPPAQQMPQANRTTEYLANERTFLAWIRTSVAVVSFGFVTGKISVMLPLLANHEPLRAQQAGAKFPVGVLMMAFGGLLAALAAWRYHVVNRAIERGAVRADRGLVAIVTMLVVLLAAVMILYMLTKPEMM